MITAQASQRNAFLVGLSSEDFSLLRSRLSHSELLAGARLHRCGEGVEDVFFPHSAVVTMTLPLLQGRGVEIALVGFDGFVGGFAAAALAPASSDSEVLVTGHAARMSAADFRDALERSPTLRQRAAQFDTTLIAQAQITALCNAAHSVEARFCRCLLEVQDRLCGERIPFTQDTLGRLLAVRRTTITLLAGRLEALGVLNCRRGMIRIADRAALERLSCECYAHGKNYAARVHRQQDDRASAAAVNSSSVLS